MEIPELVNGLYHKDANFAYQCMQELERLSKETNEVYGYMDDFLAY